MLTPDHSENVLCGVVVLHRIILNVCVKCVWSKLLERQLFVECTVCSCDEYVSFITFITVHSCSCLGSSFGNYIPADM